MMGVRRLVLASVSLGALAGGVLFSVPVALAVAPPVVEEEAVSNVAGTSATLQAKIDPQGSETTYRFEYGTSEAYGSSIPVPDGIVGSGSAGVRVTAHPQDLSPSTEYHYRVVAVVASRSETVLGEDGTFVTQPVGGEFALPDGRQWELVSPPSKQGALIGALGNAGDVQAAEDGSGIAYLANVPTEPEPPGYVFFAQLTSVHGPQGWSTRDIATPHEAAARLKGSSQEYDSFTGDLSTALVNPEGEDQTLLSALASEATPYLRREPLCDAPAGASECYLPLLSGREGFADVPAGTEFGSAVGGEPRDSLQDWSPDLHHVVLLSLVALTATPTPELELYEWSEDAPPADRLQLVSVLPASEGGGPVSPTACCLTGVSVGTVGGPVNHAVSSDGSRVFWATGGSTGEDRRLYMRDTVRQETVRLDERQPGAPGGGTPQARFQVASADGSKVFFTDGIFPRIGYGERLTAQSGSREYDLYECEITEEAGASKCRLTDLTPETGGESAEVQHMVLGGSEDGSYVYFVANGVLSQNTNSHGEKATHGTCQTDKENGEQGPPGTTCNLYEYHDGAITFVARLSEEDQTDWGASFTLRDNSKYQMARVSPDGRYVAFMSGRSLTGYDNHDASSGKPDQEVYLYDALTQRLACASCDPTGGRPVGVEHGEVFAIGGKHSENLADIANTQYLPVVNGVAANIPPGYSASLYWPRVLSDDGRLFFNSIDALMPQDVNGNEDVYEFEPAGGGSCTASSVTFSSRSGGCVSLISAGASSEESGFLDASTNGSDVFFLTTSKLTSQDYDTGRDVYDAHECTASAPCVALPVASPPCDSGDSCKGSPAVQPTIFGAPASATFAGAGNVVGSSSGRGAQVRSSTRAARLARALKACRSKPGRKRRVCERRARKRYAAVKAAARKARG